MKWRMLSNLNPWHLTFLLIIIVNILLIISGILFVPQLASTDGLMSMSAAVIMQVVLFAGAFIGPVALVRNIQYVKISFIAGIVFALLYLSVLISQFTPSINLQVNVLILFFGTPLLASLAVVISGKFKAMDIIKTSIWTAIIGTTIWTTLWLVTNYILWASKPWYFFWGNEGTLEEFRRSGSTDLVLFIIQDIHGALFFHPILSAVIGLSCGTIVVAGVKVYRLVRK